MTTLLFKTIFEQSPVSTQIFSLDGQTIMVNKAWEKLWNVKAKNIVNKYNILKDKQLIEKGTAEFIKQGFKGYQVNIPPIKYEPAKTINIKGAVEYKWLQAIIYPIKDDKNNITHIVLQHEDITERKEAEDENNKLAAIVESSEDAIVSKTTKGVITSWNKGAEKLFGYKQKEIVGKNIITIIPKELRDEENLILNKIKSGKLIQHFETTRVTKSGKKILVSLSISPIRNKNGEIIGASKIARDITKHKISEQALKESEERLRYALDAGKIGVWDWDIKNNKLTWTDNVYEIHGINKKSFKVNINNYFKLIHKEDADYVKSTIEKCLKNKQPFISEFRIVTKIPNNEIKWVTTQAIATYENGKAVRMLGATSDISHQKKLEQEKNDFLSMASHELKTPLTSMQMFIDLLAKQLEQSTMEKSKYYVKRIEDQATRLNELTNDLLDVSRIETGKLRLNKQKFSLNKLVKETVEGIQPTTKHIIKIIKGSNINVLGDKYRIYQVLINLLTNAIKYSPNDKEVIIRLCKEKNNILVSVQDFGIGIKKDQQSKVFERLYQSADSKQKTFPGLGLGLFISKGIIERHKGNIWVESEKGKGSTFYFTLPLKN